MKKTKPFLFIISLIFFTSHIFAEPVKKIKIAIFDNPVIDSTKPSLSEGINVPYMEGIETAIYVAHTKGIHILKKEFLYDNNLLSIIQQAPNVKIWNPDAIVGVYSSNSSIMSNNLFSGQLLLSISASDIKLSNRFPYFYSLGTPDVYTAKQMVNFISKQYPNRNLFILIGAENKESVDFASLVTDLYKKKNPKNTVMQHQFLSDDENTMGIKSLLEGYHSNDIILLLAISGTYNTQIDLMNNISNYLPNDKLVFISPVDNWTGRTILESTSKTKNPYTAYRFDTLFVDRNSKNYNFFSRNFENIYGRKPVDNISYITYQSIMSIVTALEDFPPPKNLSAKNAILWSYKKALEHDPDWFKFKPITIYKIEGNQEVYFQSLEEETK